MELKRITPEGVSGAIEKAERYRLLNEPRDAESICRDVLAVEPGNAAALRILVLALTDQFEHGHGVTPTQVLEVIGQLQADHDQRYLEGVCAERWGKAQLKAAGHGGQTPGWVVYEWLQRAMAAYEAADALSAADDDDARLRYNACVRIIRGHANVCPRPEDQAGDAWQDDVPAR